MKNLYAMMLGLAFATTAQAQLLAVADFEDLGAGDEACWDGSDLSAVFTSGDYAFINNYVDWGGYGSWDGFGWSTMTSTSYTQLSDQFNSCVGSGVNGSKTYGVGYYSAYMGTEPTVIAKDAMPFAATGCYVANAAYAYVSMSEGDAYAKKFDESDWFLLTVTGYLEGESTGTVDHYLAKDGNIQDDWQYVDLSALGTVDEVHFTLSSSDTGVWGMNTPAYFCIDNFGESQSTVALLSIEQQAANKCYNLHGQPGSHNGWMISNGEVRYTK